MADFRVVFLGSDPIALPMLEQLASGDGVKLVGVFTQPDRPVGRGQQVQANEIKTWAMSREIPVHQPLKLTPEEEDGLAALAPDLAVVMAYGHILRDRFIAIPRLGTINLHTSILPKYRGASPIQTAIAEGEIETGVSLMRIVRELDAGPVADVRKVPISATDTAVDVEKKLAEASREIMEGCWAPLLAGSLSFTPQNARAATFCRRLKKEDGVLDFNIAATVLAARIRGLFPWPACVVSVGGVVLKVGMAKVEISSGEIGVPGTILRADDFGVRVATRDGVLVLEKLQRPGGRMLPAAEFLRGFKIELGTVLPSARMPELLRRT